MCYGIPSNRLLLSMTRPCAFTDNADDSHIFSTNKHSPSAFSAELAIFPGSTRHAVVLMQLHTRRAIVVVMPSFHNSFPWRMSHKRQSYAPATTPASIATSRIPLICTQRAISADASRRHSIASRRGRPSDKRTVSVACFIKTSARFTCLCVTALFTAHEGHALSSCKGRQAPWGRTQGKIVSSDLPTR